MVSSRNGITEVVWQQLCSLVRLNNHGIAKSSEGDGASEVVMT